MHFCGNSKRKNILSSLSFLFVPLYLNVQSTKPLDMNKNKRNDDIYIRNCPIRNVLARICDKWSILVIFTLEQFPVMRFSELRRMIPDIS